MTDTNHHPVYFQTTPFTCGPSALMKAMQLLDPGYRPGMVEELSIWRSANLVFMGDGQAGCGAFGLGIAALSRTFNAEVYGHQIGKLFSDWTNSTDEAEAQTIIDEHDRAEFLKRGGRVFDEKISIELLRRLKDERKQLLVLVTNGEYGHWVLADQVTGNRVEILDPYKARPHEMDVPYHSDNGRNSMSHADFLDWARFGRHSATAVLAISRP